MTAPQGSTGPQDPSTPETTTSRTALVWAIVAGAAVVAGLAVWWFAMHEEPEAAPILSPSASPSESPSPTPTVTVSVTPSASPTPTPTETTLPASFEDINGRWCSTWEEASPGDCVTVSLPNIVFDAFPDQPEVVYPLDADIDADPSTYDYSGPPNSGGCWLGGIDFWPPVSGAPLMFCPAGADGEGDWEGMAGPADEDRLWPGFQEPGDAPYVRADDE